MLCDKCELLVVGKCACKPYSTECAAAIGGFKIGVDLLEKFIIYLEEHNVSSDKYREALDNFNELRKPRKE